MPIREGKTVPEFLRHYGTTWMVIFGKRGGVRHGLRQPRHPKTDSTSQSRRGDLGRNGVLDYSLPTTIMWTPFPEFQESFPCTTRTDSVVANIVENPRGFRLPCISPAVARIDHRTQDGDSWTWNEFKMTAYHFPGQTYYHGGLLVEGQGVRLFSLVILSQCRVLTITALGIVTCSVREWVMIDALLGLLNFNRPISSTATCSVPFAFTDEEIEQMRVNRR